MRYQTGHNFAVAGDIVDYTKGIHAETGAYAELNVYGYQHL
jgi:hypothetical protein